MLATTARAATIGALLSAAGATAAPPMLSATKPPAGHDETACRPVAELSPRASEGSLGRVESDLSATGWLSRWDAAEGDTLRLKVRTSGPGTYEISILVVPTTDGPALAARAWGAPLTREGGERLALQGPGQDRLVDIRFDPIPMGPGHHVLELKCLAPGEFLLDCVSLRRTGDLTGDTARPSGDRRERAFLGIQLGGPDPDGVAIVRTVPDTAAEKAELRAGDVLVKIGGTKTATRDDVLDTIESHRPGDRVELQILRDGALIIMDVQLGRRPEPESTARLEHVIEVLQVRPGQVIADIGCGSGWLSEAIAEAVGAEGTVYAVEIQERLVRRLHGWSPPNVVPVLSLPDDVSLPEDCLDTAMLHDVASHISRPARPRFYESLTRALKPDGRLVVFGPHGKADAMLRGLRRYGYVAVDAETLAALPPEDLDQRLRDGIVFRHQ
jgi:tRNA A58 N-methylase Trm61